VSDFVIAILIFVGLIAAALVALFMHRWAPVRYLDDETHNVIRVVTSLFVMMTSLMLGLLIHSAKNTFDTVDHNMHAFATEMIQLDRMLEQYGPEAKDARLALLAYVQRVLGRNWPADDVPIGADRVAEQRHNEVGDVLGAIRPADAQRIALLQDAREHYRRMVELRWTLVEQSDRAIPNQLMAMLIAWLMLIFGSLGYRAPRNLVVVSTLVLASALVAGALYLILDLDTPSTGLIQISSEPLQRTLAELNR
jgi:hypothetical protein